MREQRRPEKPFTGIDHRVRAGIAADQRPLHASRSADAQDRQQLNRHADKSVRPFLRHHPVILAITHPYTQLQRFRPEALNGLADELPQPVGSGKGKADHRHAARSDQFPESCYEETYGVPTVSFGIEDPLGCAGGARGGVGEHPLDFRLGPEQQPGCVLRQILLRRKGKLFQL